MHFFLLTPLSPSLNVFFPSVSPRHRFLFSGFFYRFQEDTRTPGHSEESVSLSSHWWHLEVIVRFEPVIVSNRERNDLVIVVPRHRLVWMLHNRNEKRIEEVASFWSECIKDIITVAIPIPCCHDHPVISFPL